MGKLRRGAVWVLFPPAGAVASTHAGMKKRNQNIVNAINNANQSGYSRTRTSIINNVPRAAPTYAPALQRQPPSRPGQRDEKTRARAARREDRAASKLRIAQTKAATKEVKRSARLQARAAKDTSISESVADAQRQPDIRTPQPALHMNSPGDSVNSATPVDELDHLAIPPVERAQVVSRAQPQVPGVQSGLDGWHPDPFGAHEERLFKDGEPTPLVKDRGIGSYSEPPSGEWRKPEVQVSPENLQPAINHPWFEAQTSTAATADVCSFCSSSVNRRVSAFESVCPTCGAVATTRPCDRCHRPVFAWAKDDYWTCRCGHHNSLYRERMATARLMGDIDPAFPTTREYSAATNLTSPFTRRQMAHQPNGTRSAWDGLHVRCLCGWEAPNGAPIWRIRSIWERHYLDISR